MRLPTSRPALSVVVLLAAAALTGCSTEEEMRAIDPAAQSAAPATASDAFPTAVPVAAGPVRTLGLTTVLDNGTGPQMCTFVADSLPPQCSGTPLSGWDWAEHAEHEEQSGTRWGDFALTGTFDGTTLTVTEATPAALYDPMNETPEPEFTTPCPAPAGGWAVVDPAKADQAAMDATFTAASALPGYAGAFIDQPDDPAAVNDPTQIVINVAVTEDLAGAEDTLRQTWGGALCVSEAAHTEAELNEIAMALQKLPGIQGSSAAEDVVQVDVLFDDGSLQAWADAAYGEGRVQITSILVPAA